MGYRLWFRTDADTTEATQQQQQLLAEKPALHFSMDRATQKGFGPLPNTGRLLINDSRILHIGHFRLL